MTRTKLESRGSATTGGALLLLAVLLLLSSLATPRTDDRAARSAAARVSVTRHRFCLIERASHQFLTSRCSVVKWCSWQSRFFLQSGPEHT